MSDDTKLVCNRCGGSLVRSQMLGSYDRLNVKIDKVWLFQENKTLNLVAYFCELCGAVQLYVEAEQKQPPRPDVQKRHHRGDLY